MAGKRWAVCTLLVFNLVVAAAMHLGMGDGLKGAAHAIEDAVMFAGLFFIGQASIVLIRDRSKKQYKHKPRCNSAALCLLGINNSR
jgi:hypothetical protein